MAAAIATRHARRRTTDDRATISYRTRKVRNKEGVSARVILERKVARACGLCKTGSSAYSQITNATVENARIFDFRASRNLGSVGSRNSRLVAEQMLLRWSFCNAFPLLFPHICFCWPPAPKYEYVVSRQHDDDDDDCVSSFLAINLPPSARALARKEDEDTEERERQQRRGGALSRL